MPRGGSPFLPDTFIRRALRGNGAGRAEPALPACTRKPLVLSADAPVTAVSVTLAAAFATAPALIRDDTRGVVTQVAGPYRLRGRERRSQRPQEAEGRCHRHAPCDPPGHDPSPPLVLSASRLAPESVRAVLVRS